jgi:hypothetical protein
MAFATREEQSFASSAFEADIMKVAILPPGHHNKHWFAVLVENRGDKDVTLRVYARLGNSGAFGAAFKTITVKARAQKADTFSIPSSKDQWKVTAQSTTGPSEGVLLLQNFSTEGTISTQTSVGASSRGGL